MAQTLTKPNENGSMFYRIYEETSNQFLKAVASASFSSKMKPLDWSLDPTMATETVLELLTIL